MSGPVRRWSSKFGVAIAGMAWAFRTQSSFYIHLPVAVCVIVAAILSGIDALRVAVLVAAIGLVLTAELLNTSVEILVKKLHPEHDADIGRVLDVAAAGVLAATIAAVVIGVLVLGPPILGLLGWLG